MMHKRRFTFATATILRFMSRTGKPHRTGLLVVVCMAAAGVSTASAYDSVSSVTIPEKSTRVFDVYVTDIVRSRNPWLQGEEYWTNELVLQMSDGAKGDNTTIISATPMATTMNVAPFRFTTRSDSCSVTRISGTQWSVKQSGPLNPTFTGTYPVGTGGTAMQCKITVRISNDGGIPQVRVRGGTLQPGGIKWEWKHDYYSVCADPTCTKGVVSLLDWGYGLTAWTARTAADYGNVTVSQPAASLSVRYNSQISLSRGQTSKPALSVEGTGVARANWRSDKDTGFLRLRGNNNSEWRPGSTITMRGGDNYDALLVPSDSMPWGTMRENWTFEWSIQ